MAAYSREAAVPHKVHYIDDTKPQIVAATGKSLLVEIAGCISGHVPGPRMGNVPPRSSAVAQTLDRGCQNAAHHNVLAIALANKLTRIAWSVLARGRSFEAQSIATAHLFDRPGQDNEHAMM